MWLILKEKVFFYAENYGRWAEDDKEEEGNKEVEIWKKDGTGKSWKNETKARPEERNYLSHPFYHDRDQSNSRVFQYRKYQEKDGDQTLYIYIYIYIYIYDYPLSQSLVNNLNSDKKKRI